MTPPNQRVYRVTPRQHEVLFWLSFGLTSDAVASRLEITHNTVRSLVRGLYRNLRVHTIAEAVRVGFETGLLSPRVERVATVVERPNRDPRGLGYAAHRGRQPAQEDLRVPGPDGAGDQRDEPDQAVGA